jgi:eukaryotic-like serine/threonine-protein kinase
VAPVKPGDVIDGKYRIEVSLGEGGMGRVFAASHLVIGNTVAIKVLRSEALAAPDVAKRFEREARAAGRLRSEHVVRIQDVGILPTGEPYMVMEMLHGNDLATRLSAGGPLPYRMLVDYVVQACEGLAEAHALGMVHRDIKPANLFVTKRPNGQGLVKVLDFGIATAATGDLDPRLTTTQSVMGSPSYMSPEQLKGARDVDARSDIWSLGVTMYELLSGQQPFVGPTLTALSLSIVTDPHRQLSGVPRELVKIVDRCLQKEVGDRFANVAELARALSPLYEGGGIAADMVAGSYSQPVAPTLHGIEPLGTMPTAASMPAARAAAMTSTTSLASGETGTTMPAPRRRWMLIGAVATVVLGIGIGTVVGMSSSGENQAAAQPTPLPPPQPAPQPQLAPPPPAPPAVVQPPPVAEPIVEPPAPTPEPDPKPTPKPPSRPRPRPPKPPLQVQPQPQPQPQPPPPPPPTPNPDPVKKPCAPNDPRCGL